LIAALLLAWGATGCGGGGGDGGGESAVSLKKSLIPPAKIKPLVLRQSFSWSDPIDYVGQGLLLPETTLPSKAVAAMNDDGFTAAAGQLLVPKQGGVEVHELAASFDSADGAQKAQAYLHQQDLRQPCAAACIVSPKPYKLPGIPNLEAVHQVPNGVKPPPGEKPFERYLAEFRVGSNVYSVATDGSPGDVSPLQFKQGMQMIYQYAQR
jgi:hypothetical protein